MQIKNNFKDYEIGYEMIMGSFDHFVLKRKSLKLRILVHPTSWSCLHPGLVVPQIIIVTNQSVVHLAFYEYISKDYVNKYFI